MNGLNDEKAEPGGTMVRPCRSGVLVEEEGSKLLASSCWWADAATSVILLVAGENMSDIFLAAGENGSKTTNSRRSRCDLEVTGEGRIWGCSMTLFRIGVEDDPIMSSKPRWNGVGRISFRALPPSPPMLLVAEAGSLGAGRASYSSSDSSACF